MAERIGLRCFPVDHPVYNLVSLEWYRAINRISLARMHGLLRDILGGMLESGDRHIALRSSFVVNDTE